MQSLANRRAGAAGCSSGRTTTTSSRTRLSAPICRAAKHETPAAAIAAGLVAVLAGAPAAHAVAQPMMQLAEVDSAMTLAVGGSAAVAGLGALLVATDPQKR